MDWNVEWNDFSYHEICRFGMHACLKLCTWLEGVSKTRTVNRREIFDCCVEYANRFEWIVDRDIR